MRLLSKEQKLTADDSALVQLPEKRQLLVYDINEEQALTHFKQMPWAKVLITPKFWWFRQ